LKGFIVVSGIGDTIGKKIVKPGPGTLLRLVRRGGLGPYLEVCTKDVYYEEDKYDGIVSGYWDECTLSEVRSKRVLSDDDIVKYISEVTSQWTSKAEEEYALADALLKAHSENVGI